MKLNLSYAILYFSFFLNVVEIIYIEPVTATSSSVSGDQPHNNPLASHLNLIYTILQDFPDDLLLTNGSRYYDRGDFDVDGAAFGLCSESPCENNGRCIESCDYHGEDSVSLLSLMSLRELRLSW